MQPDTRDAGYLFDMLPFSREAVAIAADARVEVDWLVHGYREIEWARLLEVVEIHLPRLLQQLADLVPPAPES